MLSYPIQFGGMVFHFEQLGAGLAHLQDTVLTPLPEEALALLETTSVNVLWFLVILVSVHLFMSEWPRMREWLIDLANPNQTERSGFTAASAKAGDAIVVLGNRSKDKSQLWMKAVRITVAGKTYDLYPERIKTN